MATRLPDHVASLLACPDCGGTFEHDTAGCFCTACARRYTLEEGVYDLMPTDRLPVPALHGDPDFQRLTELSTKLHEDYYKPGSISGRLEDRFKRDLLAMADTVSDPVVDFGCGAGRMFSHLAAHGHVVGVDCDASLLRQAAVEHPDSTLLCCDMASPPFRPASLQTIIALGVLEHLFYLEHILMQIERLLHPDGCFLVLIPAEGGLAWSLARKLFTAPYFTRTYGFDYERALRVSHCNRAAMVDNCLRKFFVVERRRLFPFGLGGVHCNLAIYYRLRKRI